MILLLQVYYNLHEQKNRTLSLTQLKLVNFINYG